MVTIIPELVNELDLSRQHRLELTQQLQAIQIQVFQTLTSLVSTSANQIESIVIAILRTLRVLFSFLHSSDLI